MCECVNSKIPFWGSSVDSIEKKACSLYLVTLSDSTRISWQYGPVLGVPCPPAPPAPLPPYMWHGGVELPTWAA